MAAAGETKNKSKLNRLGPFQALGVVFLCAVALVYLYPLFWMADAAFRPSVEIFQFPPTLFREPLLEAIRGYTLESFRKALLEWHIDWAFLMSVFVTFAGIALTLLVCSLCAYAFAYIEFPGKNVLFVLLLSTMMLPMTTMIVPSYKVIRTLHLSDNPFGLILPYAVSAFGVFLLRQFFIKIPRGLLESARIDGAGHLKIWWNVIMPLAKPALAALSIVQFRVIWSDFLMPMIILKSDEFYTLPVRIQVMDSQHFDKPYDAIIATGFVAALIPMIAFLIFQRQFIENLTGGIKE